MSILIAVALAATAGARDGGPTATPEELVGPPVPVTSASPAVSPSPEESTRSPASATPEVSPSAEATPTLLSHHWIVDERQSVMDDSVILTFSVLGIRDSATDHATNDLLILRLREATWDVMVSTNHEYLGAQFPPVKVRWDENKPEDELRLSSSDYTAAFCPTPRKFIARAKSASRLVVRLFPKFAGESTVVFDLSGLTDEIDKHAVAKAALVEPAGPVVKKAKSSP